MKVCPLTRISNPAPENRGYLLHGKSIPVLPWSNGTRACVLRTNGFIRPGSLNTGSCSRYSLSSEYMHAPLPHSIVLSSDFPFLRGAETSAKDGMWSL